MSFNENFCFALRDAKTRGPNLEELETRPVSHSAEKFWSQPGSGQIIELALTLC